MAYSVTPLVGVSLVPIQQAIQSTFSLADQPGFALGTQVFGSDGKIYVFCKANASITASTAVCTVNPATFQATATAGAYLSPASNMVTGDYGWFGRAGV